MKSIGQGGVGQWRRGDWNQDLPPLLVLYSHPSSTDSGRWLCVCQTNQSPCALKLPSDRSLKPACAYDESPAPAPFQYAGMQHTAAGEAVLYVCAAGRLSSSLPTTLRLGSTDEHYRVQFAILSATYKLPKQLGVRIL